MGVLYPFELISNEIQLTILIVLLFFVTIKLKNHRSETERYLFLGGMLCYILLDFYWCMHIWLYQTGPSVFSVTDVGFVGGLFFWTAFVKHRYGKKKRMWTVYSVGAVLFGVINCVWWILWNGKVPVNLLWAAGCIPWNKTVAEIAEDEGISKRTKYVLGLAAVLLSVALIVQHYCGGRMYRILDISCYALWIIGAGVSLLDCICEKKRSVVSGFAAFTWLMYAQFASEGVMYSVFVNLLTISIMIVVIRYLRIGEDRDDIC